MSAEKQMCRVLRGERLIFRGFHGAAIVVDGSTANDDFLWNLRETLRKIKRMRAADRKRRRGFR